MAFAALGIVFGDIGTSPLYAFEESIRATGPDSSRTAIMGVTSLIFWTVNIIVSIKYLLFVTRVDNEGEGGIFAIAAVLKKRVHESRGLVHLFIMALVVLSTALLFADSVITPPLSILAATEGLQQIYPDSGKFVIIASLIIIVALYGAQRFGTQILSRFFSPIMLCWFIVIGLLGLKEVVATPGILVAISPFYAYQLISILSWHQVFSLLGSVLLAATGAEAIYVDMGHFGRKPISVAWYSVALSALLLNYFGQACWYLQQQGTAQAEVSSFFGMVPVSLIVPMVILATMACVIAGQAVISGMFSIVNQTIRQNYLPRFTVLQTSEDMRGQIYVPLINYLLLFGGILLILGFQSSSALAESYGFAVSATMLLTTLAFSMVILLVWKWSVWKVVVFLFFALPLDGLFFAATISKLPAGHYFTLLLSIFISWFILAWLLGNRYLMRKAQRIDIPVADFADIVELRNDLKRQDRAAVFLQHLPFPPEVRVTPFALLQQVQVTSMVYQPTIIVQFLSSSAPRVDESERLSVHEYQQGITLVNVTFGFWEKLSLDAVVALGKERGWWKREEDIVYFSAKENLKSGGAGGLPLAIKWPFAMLHSLDQRIIDTLKLDPTRCVELGVRVDI